MKILLIGILGGIVMSVWASVAHMALPLGEAGIDEIPNQSAVLSAMQTNIGDRNGFYIFPGPGVGKNATRQEKKARQPRIIDRASRSFRELPAPSVTAGHSLFRTSPQLCHRCV